MLGFSPNEDASSLESGHILDTIVPNKTETITEGNGL